MARKPICKVCKQEFPEYEELRDHFKEYHTKKWEEVSRQLENHEQDSLWLENQAKESM